MHPLSADRVNDVINCLNNGLSFRETSCETLVSYAVVQKIAKTNFPDREFPKNDRPPKVTPRVEKLMVQKVTKGGVESAVTVANQLQDELGLSVSSKTVIRCLEKQGIEPFKKGKKPKLSGKNVKERLIWAKSHLEWTEDDWSRVIWSDETKINRFGSDGQHWCYKRKEEPIKPRHVKQTVSHGGGNIMI